jgi:hypothetical protein
MALYNVGLFDFLDQTGLILLLVVESNRGMREEVPGSSLQFAE